MTMMWSLEISRVSPSRHSQQAQDSPGIGARETRKGVRIDTLQSIAVVRIYPCFGSPGGVLPWLHGSGLLSFSLSLLADVMPWPRYFS